MKRVDKKKNRKNRTLNCICLISPFWITQFELDRSLTAGDRETNGISGQNIPVSKLQDKNDIQILLVKKVCLMTALRNDVQDSPIGLLTLWLVCFQHLTEIWILCVYCCSHLYNHFASIIVHLFMSLYLGVISDKTSMCQNGFRA